MSAEILIPLTFATFYICGVKDLTTFNQRTSINILLKNIRPIKGDCGDPETITDTDCSNYSKGKRALSNDLQKELNELSKEAAMERLKKLGIQDESSMANALRTLVQNSSLSENEKRELLENYQTEDKLTFIAKVFLKCVKGNNFNPVTNEQIKVLTKYNTPSALSDGKNSGLVIFQNQKVPNEVYTDFPADTENNDNLIRKNDCGSRFKLEYDEFNLPEDYQRIIDILNTATSEANLQSFQMNEVIEALDIDVVCNSLKEGYLEYWQVDGKIEHILAPFKRHDFSDVSAFVIHLFGHFNLSQSKTIELFLRKVSNDNVSLHTSLCYKEAADTKLILLVHRNKRKAREQTLDDEHDGTRVWERNCKS